MLMAACGLAKMDNFDLVIKNGHVIDPFSDIDGQFNIGIKNGKIALISNVSMIGKSEINADGCIVTPGLIDFHTHLFDGGSMYGINPDFLLSQGVTAAVDAGTSGSAGYEAFHRSVIDTSALTIKAFISLGATGLCDPNHKQNYAKEKVNVARIKALKEKYPKEIIGIKVAMSKHDVGELGIEPLLTAVELANEIGDMRVCIHSTDPPCSCDELLVPLRAGDIVCHCYHGTGSCILDESGKVQRAYLEARERGVIFDMANGISHFSHQSALGAIKNGFLPDVISSDMVSFAYGVSKRNKSLPYVMSKLYAMGMRMVDIIKATTQVPAELMGLSGRIGTLQAGSTADVALFRMEKHEILFEDAHLQQFKGESLLCPQMTIKGGQVAFFQNTFNI